MWAAQFVKYEKPGTWLNSGGLGTMGYAVPAAMGAKAGRPEATVWAIDGDGCFQMTNQELATCAIEGIPVKVALINNGNLGMVRQWQTLFYEGRYSNTRLHNRGSGGGEIEPIRIPDFVKLGEALGCVGCAASGPRTSTPSSRRRWRSTTAGGHRLRGRLRRPGLADGRRRRQQRRHPGRAGRPPGLHGGTGLMTRHTLSVLVENKSGVLARVSALFSRRGFNIESLAVGPTENPDLSRMTIVVDVESQPLEQITKQLNKLVEVIKIVELDGASVQRELLLVKVRAPLADRAQVLQTVELFRAKVIDVNADTVTVEATGTTEKLQALLAVLAPLGIKEMAQSGTVALARDRAR